MEPIELTEIVKSCPVCLKETNEEHALIDEGRWSPLAQNEYCCCKCGKVFKFISEKKGGEKHV